MSMGNFPETLSQGISVGINIVERLGVAGGPSRRNAGLGPAKSIKLVNNAAELYEV